MLTGWCGGAIALEYTVSFSPKNTHQWSYCHKSNPSTPGNHNMTSTFQFLKTECPNFFRLHIVEYWRNACLFMLNVDLLIASLSTVGSMDISICFKKPKYQKMRKISWHKDYTEGYKWTSFRPFCAHVIKCWHLTYLLITEHQINPTT